MHFLTRLIVASLACSAVTAEAQVQDTLWSIARARMGQLSLSFYDANPNDSVAPSFRFLDAANAWRTFTYIGVYAPSDLNGDLAFRDQVTFSLHQDAVLPTVQSVGIFTADGFRGAGGAWGLAAGEIGAQGQARGLDRAFYAHAGLATTATEGPSPTFRNLVLGAGTGVRLSSYAITEAWLGLYGEMSWANAELMAEFSPADASGVFQSGLASRQTDVIASELYQGSPEMALPYNGLVKVIDQRTLLVSFENLSETEVVGRVRYMVNVEGASLVPEPQVAWLLLTGLPLLGWTAKRRRAKVC